MASPNIVSKSQKVVQSANIFVVLHILFHQLICTTAVESQNQAFIQTDNVLRYVVDGKPFQLASGRGIPSLQDEDDSLLSSLIRFHPPILDFDEQPVGMPKMEQVTVSNTDSTTSVQLLSISGTTVHFHCSFFQDKSVPPRTNTSFDVVFLARQVGNVENTLYIHTSLGTFRYQVFGVGTSNPYRLQPFIGAKVPINSTFSPLIHMYNPHSTALQVIEMYSSGGDLHLELPSGDKDAPKKLWEIPPYETKAVMRASFVGRLANNHTAFIRIKTNKSTASNEMLVLPVEVEVTSAPGIFSSVEKLDFDILRTLDPPKTLRLNLLNSISKPVHITSVSVFPPNDAIGIEFRPVKLMPGILRRTPVALVTYTAEKAVNPKQWSGHIVVSTKDDEYRLTLPYQALVLHGSLVYNRNDTMFYSGKMENLTRTIPLTNTFGFTLVLYNYSIPEDVQKYFSIVNFTRPLYIQPQESFQHIAIQFSPNSTELHLAFDLQLSTNASVFTLPIYVYNGRLKVVHHRPEILKGQLDFGTMGIEEGRSMTFTLRNDNPIDIIVSEYSSKMDKTTVELLGVEKGNGTTLTRKHNVSSQEATPLVLKPFHYAVFSVNLVAPDWEATFVTDVLIRTQFEHLYIPMTLRTAKGSLRAIPEQIIFDKVYPGKISYKVLRIHSSFTNLTEVRDVAFQPKDARFYYMTPKGAPVVLKPLQDTVIGKVYFDARKECGDDCYVSLPTYTPAGHQWLLGLTLDKEVTDTDQYLYTRFQQKWEILGARDQSTINTTIQLDTNQVWGFLFPAHAHLYWPTLINRSRLKFPLTQIGNTSVLSFQVENPGDTSVLIQALPLSVYPNAQTIADLIGKSLPTELDDFIDYDDDVFTLVDLHNTNTSEYSTIASQRKQLESTLGVKPHPSTIANILQPGQKLNIDVGFTPRDDTPKTTLILLRNNLTIIDHVLVQGRGGTGAMRFSNRPPGSQSPLLFDMTEKHLKDCDKKKSSKMIPNFTVRRFFTIKNHGELAFYVHGFSILDLPCEGYGFRVLNCSGFLLEPNASEKIHIIFTPDFTMSRIQRVLTVHTTLGPSVNFTLQATLPPYMLTKCAGVLPRPAWEPLLYYSAVSSMVFLLLCIVAAAYFEADRIYTADIIQRRFHNPLHSPTFDKSKIFDLRKLGDEYKRDDIVKRKSTELPNGHTIDKRKDAVSATVHNRIKPEPVKTVKTPVLNGVKPVERKVKCNNIKRDDTTRKEKKERTEEKSESPSSKEAIEETKVNHIQKVELVILEESPPKREDKTKQLKRRGGVKPVQPRKQEYVVERRAAAAASGVKMEPSPSPSESYDNDRDDTSSISTESSLDNEYKSVTRDCTSDFLSSKPVKLARNKNKNKKKPNSELIDLANTKSMDSADEDFVLSTKSKAHKKMKANKQSGYGPRPSSLDLALATKLSHESSKENVQPPSRVEPPSPHTIASEVVNRTTRAMKNNKNKQKLDELLHVDIPDDQTENEARGSPPPLWDVALPLPPDGDLSELAFQSQQFALKLARLQSSGPASSDSLSSSSSYSSIVSSLADNGKKAVNGAGAAPMTATSVGREANQPRSLTVPEVKFPGPVGSKTLMKPRANTTGTLAAPKPWNVPSGTPTSPETLPFCLNPIQELSPPPSQQNMAALMQASMAANGAASLEQLMMMPPEIQAQILNEQHAGSLYGLQTMPQGVYGAPYEPTMMQRLQAERRKRLIEYQRRLLRNEDWPGFDVNPTNPSEMLWDTPPYQKPQDWNSRGTYPAPQEPSWEQQPTTTASDWNTLSSIWTSYPGNTSEANSLLDLETTNACNPDTSNENIGTFDPFNALGSIWCPGGGGSSSGWSQNPNNDTPN